MVVFRRRRGVSGAERIRCHSLILGDDAVHGEAAYTFVEEAQLELLYTKHDRRSADAEMEAGTSHVHHDRKEEEQHIYNGSPDKARNGELREVASE